MPNGSSQGQLPYHNGTSAAVPYVTGVAALLKAVNPSLTGSEIASLLVSTGLQVVSSSNHPQVWVEPGRLIQPLEAVIAANNGKMMKPQVHLTAPKDHATVGEQLYHGVNFAPRAEDIQEFPKGGTS